MTTTAYAVTVTPPVAGGFYTPVEVRFEHAAAPAAEPNPNPAYLVRDGSTPLQGRMLINDATTFYFPAVTPVLLTTWAGGDDASKQSVTPAAYATPTSVVLTPTSSGTQSTELSSRYLPGRTFTIEDARDADGLLFIAHRGGPNLHPEHTMAAYRAIVEQGAVAIEQDCCLLADGSLGVMHDGTLDRTTTAGGNTVDQTAASWQVLSVDHGATLGGAYTSYVERPPMFEEVVRQFGNKVILVPEAKTTGAGAAIVAVLQKYGVRTDAAIVQSFTLSELSAAVTAGYRTCFLGTGQTPATVAAAGVDSICVASTEAQATFTAITAAGLEAGAYTISRHDERDTLIGYGCTFFFSDDPIYLSGTGYKRTTDPFASYTWYHGHLTLGSVASRGGFGQTVAGSWGINSTLAQYGGALQGWASPIQHASFELTFTAKFNVNLTSGRWVGLFLGTTDKEFTDSASTGVHGYHFVARNTSLLNAYKVTDGAASHLLTTSTVTAIADGGTATLKLTVTPTTFTWERTDVAVSTGAISESTYRPAGGWYLALGRNGVAAEFYDVTITEL